MGHRSLFGSAARVGFAATVLAGCSVGTAAQRQIGALFSTPRSATTKGAPISKDARLAVLWVGQSTVLLQLDDKVILTDPVLTSTVGQFTKRLVEPGVDASNMPSIDAVLVSNVEVDHLSLASLEKIDHKVKTLLMPEGGTAYLPGRWSFPSYEMRPWQAWESGGLRVSSVPLRHTGGRYGIDREWMPSSYVGYVIEYHGLKVYFAGDTAYEQAQFVQVSERFPSIDLALLPIAPMAPKEALQAQVDLNAKWMVPVHFGTFPSAAGGPEAPLRALTEAEREVPIGDRTVVPLAIGERRVLVKVTSREQRRPE